MSLHRRLAALEKKRKANEPPMREVGMFAGKPVFKTEERDGVVYCLPLYSDDEYSELCRLQQKRLFEKLAEYAAQLDEGEQGGRDTGPHSVGKTSDELPPLPPGKKRRRYVLIKDADGIEWQRDLLTNDQWRT